MKKTYDLDLIKTQVWINSLLKDLGISADQLEKNMYPHKKHPTNSIHRWSTGQTKPNIISANRINEKFPQAKIIYDLAIWKLLDDRTKKKEVLIGKNIIEKINQEASSESPYALLFLQCLYDMRVEEINNDAYMHYKKMQQCLTLFPFYFSKNTFLGYTLDFAYMLYCCSRSMSGTESRIMPNYDLLTYFTENIEDYDLEKSEKPFIYLTDFLQ